MTPEDQIEEDEQKISATHKAMGAGIITAVRSKMT
jgi:hypothetical protein